FPATRWPRSAPTGPPTPTRRSAGAWRTSPAATAPRAARGLTSRRSAGTEVARLLGPTDIRNLAASLGAMPTKKWGQNFVVDAGTVRRIARASGVGPGDQVLEIGPGLGSLTLALLETGADVTAIEIDPRLAAALPRTIAERAPEDAERLTVIPADALTVRELAAPPQAVVANLPYNVGVPILLHLLATFPSIARALVMVQA